MKIRKIINTYITEQKMARTARKTHKSKKIKPYVLTPTGFNMSNLLGALGNINKSRLTKKQKKNIENIQMASRRSARMSRPVSRYVPAVSTSKRVTKKKNTKKNETVPVSRVMNVIIEEPRAVVEVKTQKPQTIRAKQLGPIMRTYEGKAGKENKYAYFKSIKNMYNTRKNNYGFGPETNIKNILKAMEAPPTNNLNNLAALLGETKIENNNNL
jgi:hypothetical protein